MDREVWQATVHGVTRVRHDLATKPPCLCFDWKKYFYVFKFIHFFSMISSNYLLQSILYHMQSTFHLKKLNLAPVYILSLSIV